LGTGIKFITCLAILLRQFTIDVVDLIIGNNAYPYNFLFNISGFWVFNIKNPGGVLRDKELY